MDNYEDFPSVPQRPSKLASLFGFSKSSTLDNSTLTYVAPKQPNGEENSKHPTTNGGVKLKVVLAKPVRAYKLIDGVYQDLGKTGLTLLGCKTALLYQLLLYKTRSELISRARILKGFIFSLHENNYASFYSDEQQNFSVHFESSSDLREFARQLIICRSYSEPQTTAITQDLAFGDSSSSADLERIDISYTGHKLTVDDSTVIINESQKAITGKEPHPWVAALSPMRVGAEIAIILPRNMSEPWTFLLDQDQMKLMLEVKRISQVLPNIERPRDVVDESAIDSSNDESIGGKKCLKESPVRSHKADLLSRMARMGKATLPLRGAVPANPSDSEEEGPPSPKPRIRTKPSAVLESIPAAVESNFRRSQPSVHQPPIASPAQSVALYQPAPIHSQIIYQRSDVPGCSSLVSTAASTLTSPSDSSLLAHFSESRTQATELRMGLGKVADKVDLVLNKIQELDHPKSSPPQTAVDPGGILSGVGALVSENAALRVKVDDLQQKIETQNERIYHLLEFSQKTMEQKSATQQMELDAKNVGNQEKEKVLTQELFEAQSKISLLEKQIEEYRENLHSVTEENKATKSKLSSVENDKLHVESLLEQANKKLVDAECALNNLQSSPKNDEELLNLQQELLILQGKLREKDNYISKMQGEWDELVKSKSEQMLLLETKSTQIKDLEMKIAVQGTRLEEQRGNGLEVDEVKALMNQLYRSSLTEFELSQQYSGSQIKQTLASVIRDMTLKFLESNSARTEDSKNNSSNVEETIHQSVSQNDVVQLSVTDTVNTPKENVTPVLDESNFSIASLMSPEVDQRGEQVIADGASAIESESLIVKEIPWKVQDFQDWRSTQPPPPPLFDEDEGTDSDWT